MKLAELISADTQQQIDILHQDFLSLDKNEQTLLIILSVVYKPIGAVKLNQVINTLINQGLLAGVKADYMLTPLQREQWIKSKLLLESREGLQLNRLLANRLTSEIGDLPTPKRLSAREKLLSVLLAAEDIVPVIHSHSWQNKNIDKQRMIRDLFCLNEFEQAQALLEFNKNPQIIDHNSNRILVELLFLPFDHDAFLQLPGAIQYHAFAALFRICQVQGHSSDYPVLLLEKVCAAHSETSNPLDYANCRCLLAEQYLFQLRFAEFEEITAQINVSSYALQLQAAFYFLKGENTDALELFKAAITAKSKITKRKKQYLNDVLGYFYKLALLVDENQVDNVGYQSAMQQIEYEDSDRKVHSDFFALSRSLEKTIRCLSTGGKYSSPLGYGNIAKESDLFCHTLGNLNYLISHAWCNSDKNADLVALAAQCQANFKQLDYGLFAVISEQLQMAFMSKNESVAEHSDTVYAPMLVNFPKLITARPQWDLALDKLIALNPNNRNTLSQQPETAVQKSRLIWVLEIGYEHRLSAREQKLNKSGWSKGRVVSLERLKEQTHLFSYLSEKDIAICQAITTYQDRSYYSNTHYTLEGLSALDAAVGIDNLYATDNLTQPIDLIKREPELLVNQQGDELCLSIADLSSAITASEQDPYQPTYDLKALSAKQYQLTIFAPEHIKVAEIIGEGGLLIPSSAKKKVLESIAAIAPLLNIQSDIPELDTGLEVCECDSRLVVNIQPTQHGLSFTCLIMPFGELGPAFKPGLGNANLSAEIEGKRVATARDLIREEVCLDQLDEVCSAFTEMSDNVLVKDEFQAALSVLEQLESAVNQSDFQLVLRWPKGKKIKLSQSLDSAQMQLGLSKNSEWFDITGNLQVNNEQVIELRKLLELVSTSNGRFIAMDSNQILALSSDLRNKLEQINQVTDEGKFHPLASLQVEEATTGMRMKTLHAWDKQTHAMHSANEIEPVIPSTLQAELRDYQLVGFDWASRLSHWGAGACLADDMGLGKTLQALAVLLSRADKGPSLVIAPTSVCFNWQQEALKFAPTLKMKLFADSHGTLERGKLLQNLEAFDCIVISYGLLQRENELLQKVQWSTIIADEAQALKNPLAKRTKAAIALKGDFKMITTGTPIENDLIELWSLFRFITPGLLGNLKRFVKRFAQPIENVKDDKLAAHKARQGLKTLIEPFILRRMKNQVLTELPSRTEINVHVEMSANERAFYEGLRLNAIDNISQAGTKSSVAEQRIKMLAELVKLRQACCNPKLVLAETDIPSAKMAALDELLDELRLNNHKALIFSQFVGHLQLIKQHLVNKGFSFQYLDGATPQKERQKRVNAFQSGGGDVFLISLKAGGSGLNLTAADYVIHMDPWWNPAVEDQASDRAHRMGQKRPVTIYRLINKNTIEEKIVALHQHKRDLADKLLSGNDTATKLSVEDMLNLLKETF